MKGTTKWVVAALAVSVGVMVTGPSGLAAQDPVRGERIVQEGECPGGIVEGSLGISGLDCVGECSLMIWGDGTERSWSFSTEPKIIAIDEGSPADGVLQVGDFLVSIDGLLITTKEGGDRYASLQPGERVRVRFRRSGRIGEADMQVVGRCREKRERAGLTARVPPPPPKPDEPRAVGIAVAPKVRVAQEARVVTGVSVAVDSVVGVAGARAMEIGVRMPQTGRLGIQFSCGKCGTQENPTTGESVWFFSGPLEVTGVTPGGPAEGAGIQIGDLIKAIDGHLMETDEGGLAFTSLKAGERTTLTVVKRNGSEVDVGLVPEARVIVGMAAPVPEPAGVAAGARPAPPRPPREVEVAEPVVSAGAEVGMPLRYSGTMQGVEIEVRGNPVTVSKLEGARTIYIHADGLWIRITVPPAGGTGKE